MGCLPPALPHAPCDCCCVGCILYTGCLTPDGGQGTGDRPGETVSVRVVYLSVCALRLCALLCAVSVCLSFSESVCPFGALCLYVRIRHGLVPSAYSA